MLRVWHGVTFLPATTLVSHVTVVLGLPAAERPRSAWPHSAATSRRRWASRCSPAMRCRPWSSRCWPRESCSKSGGQRYVLCAVDWCELCDGSHDDVAEKDCGRRRHRRWPTLPCSTIHQHTAPLVDSDAQKLLAEAGLPGAHVDPKAFDAIEQRYWRQRCSARWSSFEPFDQIGTGQAKVDRVASSRRAPDADGQDSSSASATARDPAIRALPEGPIDPYLKTITLARGEKPLVRLHYYATHPQSQYGDNRASSDFPGDARETLQRKEGVFQIYFTGCGGDITVGKYNDGSQRNALRSWPRGSWPAWRLRWRRPSSPRRGRSAGGPTRSRCPGGPTRASAWPTAWPD